MAAKTAASIQDYVKQNGNITSAEQLLDIKGIGEKTLMKIKPFLKF
jgi:DNA uptake protein ComE-like DNA-binding protein